MIIFLRAIQTRRNYHIAIPLQDSMSMEPTLSPSESEVHYGEDFVHTEDARATGDISLSNSIMNVEKEELLNQAAEEEQKDYDSVVSGGNAARDDGESSSETTKVDLTEELAESVVILTCESTGIDGYCEVYLIGTSHLSAKSCREVKALVSILKPEVVFLELCSRRMSILKPKTLKVPTRSDMNTFGKLYGWFLAKMASQREVIPGNEFRVAYEEAMKYGGIVILGDRPIQITFKRTWAKMPLWHKVKFLLWMLYLAVYLLWLSIWRFWPNNEELNKNLEETMDDVDLVTLIQKLSKLFPSLVDTLVNERDQYMSSFLLRIASEHSSVVAVVGKAHVNGIKKNWKQPITMIDMMEIPRDESRFTVKRIISVAIAVSSIVFGILLTRRW